MDLEEREKSFKELKIISNKQEKRVHYYETRAHNLTIAYLFLQAIFFLAISSSSSSSRKQNQWWVPFSMILISSLIFFMSFLDAVIMFYRVQYHLDLTYMELDLMFTKIQVAKQPVPKNHLSVHITRDQSDQHHEIIRHDAFQLFKRKVYIYSITFALLAFTGIQLCACRLFLVR